MNKLQAAEQFRKAVQLFAGTLSEDDALAVATIYDPYVVGKAYKTGDYFTYGENGVGDPQLYKVVQDHTSQADWTPDTAASLYTPIGLTAEGYAIWSQPTGAHDAYNKGDIVEYEGALYISTVDGNTYAPGVVAGQWEPYTA